MRLRRWTLISSLLVLGPALLPAETQKPKPIELKASVTVEKSALQAPGASRQFPGIAIAAAMTYLGAPYVHGGDTGEGFDCSGLVYRVFHDTAGLDLPRGVEGLFSQGVPVRSPMHIGDLVFFDTSGNATPSIPTHVGIYAGGDRFVHAASEGARPGVIISSLENTYYRTRFLGARRVVPWRLPVLALTLTDDHQTILEARPFPSREPLTLSVYNRMTGGGPVDLSVLKDGTEVLSRRIVPGAQKPAEISIVPEVGTWTVRITRIFKGRELLSAAFTVEE